MNPSRRAMMFRVIDGDERVIPYMYDLNNTPKHCDDILKMCIERGLTGRNFIAWTKTPEAVALLSRAYSGQLPHGKLGSILLKKFERAAREMKKGRG